MDDYFPSLIFVHRVIRGIFERLFESLKASCAPAPLKSRTC